MQLSKHLQMQAMQFYLLIKLFGFEVDLIQVAPKKYLRVKEYHREGRKTKWKKKC
jgi:hypothetical protein